MQAAPRFRAVSMGLISGFIAGILPGIGARIAMRIVTLAAGLPPSFSFAGTFGGIMLPASLIGASLGLLFVVLKPYLPATGRWLQQGLAFGLLLFIVVGLPFFLLERMFTSEIRVAPLSVRIIFYMLPLVFGVAIGAITNVLDGVWSAEATSDRQGYVIVASGAGILAGILGSVLFVLVYASLLQQGGFLVGRNLRAVLNGRPPGLSLDLILAVFVALALPAVIAGTFYLVFEKRVPGPQRWKGLVFGCIFMLLLAAPALLTPLGSSRGLLALSFVQKSLRTGIGTIVAITIIYCIIINAAVQSLDTGRRLPNGFTAFAAVTGLVGITLLIAQMVG